MKNPLSGTHSDPSSNLICLGFGLEGLFWLDKAPFKGYYIAFQKYAEMQAHYLAQSFFLDYKKQKE